MEFEEIPKTAWDSDSDDEMEDEDDKDERRNRKSAPPLILVCEDPC